MTCDSRSLTYDPFKKETESDCAAEEKGKVTNDTILLVTHPGEGEVHLHLRHPLPHAGSHPDAEGDEAVRVVLVHRPVSAVATIVRAQPALGDEVLRVNELGLIVTDGVMTQMELSLEGEKIL